MIVCPIAIAQRGTGYKITCLSVCLSSLLRPQFFSAICMKFRTVIQVLKSEVEFVWGEKSDDPFLYFVPLENEEKPSDIREISPERRQMPTEGKI